MPRKTTHKTYCLIALLILVLFGCFGLSGYFGEAHARTNQPPVAVADSYTTHGTLSMAAPGFLGNDSDPDGGTVKFSGLTGCSAGTHGTLCVGNLRDGAFSYTPQPGFSGTDVYTYTVYDDPGGASASSTITFNVIQSPPTAADDSFSLHSAISQPAPGLLGNDSDPDGDPIHFSGTPGCGPLNYGWFCRQANGSFSYSPNNGVGGTDTFTYSVCDNQGGCSNSTVTFNVHNAAPAAGADVYSGEGLITVPAPGILSNDSDPDGDALSLTTAGPGTAAQYGHVTIAANGAMTYNPNPGFTGVDKYQYQVCDSRGVCSTALVYFYVYDSCGCQSCNDPKLAGGTGSAWGTEDPVSLVTGRESHTPGPDLTVYNPSGPSAGWQRSYLGRRGMQGYGSPGLSLGWVHNYDYRLVGPPSGTWGALTLIRNDGTKETLTPVLNGAGQPTGEFTEGAGVAYFATGVPGAMTGEWQSVTITSKDQAQWRFTPSTELHPAPPPSTETVWVEDSLPAGARAVGDADGWNWITSNPAPYSGTSAHRSGVMAGVHQHFFYNATSTLSVGTGDTLFTYVYLDPANVPSEVMLQWRTWAAWDHRAYWGANDIGWGTDGTNTRRYMGSLPAAGGWVRLEVPASQVGLEGRTVNGMTYTLYGGRATWDKSGKASAQPPSYPSITYVPTRMTNRVGRSIDLGWGADRSLSQVSDTTSGTVLLSLAYDARGKLSTATDAYGRQVAYTFSTPTGTDPGKLASVSQTVAAGTANPPARYGFTYSAAAHQQLTSITVPSATGSGSATATINYDSTPKAKVTSLVDANGNRREITYNSGNTQVQAKDAAGGVVATWTQNFNASGRDTGVTDAGGSTLVEYADPQNPDKVTRVVDRNGKATVYTYDSHGNVLTVTTPRGVTTTYAWSYAAFALGRLSSVQEGTKPATTFAYYEPSGLVQSVTSASPTGTGTVARTYTYDALGNVLTVTGPGNNAAGQITTVYDYTTDGSYTQPARVRQPLTATDNLGHTTHLRYDAQGRPISRTDALGHETNAAYNLAGQWEDITNPATGQSGAGRSRVVKSYLYVGGPPTSVTLYDESNVQVRQVSYGYGAEGEVLSVSGSTEPASYAYDALYRLKTLKDGKNNTTTYNYDAVGNVSSVQMPGGETIQFPLHDPSGRVLRRIDGNGVTTDYAYNDPENLLTDIQYPATPALNVHFGYDAYGRRASMTDGAGSHAYTYGDLDELKSNTTTYTGLPARTLTYQYNPDGSRQSMTTPAGTFAYTYDGAGYLSGLTNPFNEATGWERDGNGRVRNQYLANGAWTTYTHNAVGQLTGLTNSDSVGAVLSQFGSIAYDGAGNRTQLTASLPGSPSLGGVTDYQYDGKDQLTQEQTTRGGGFAETFGYDAAGNPTSFRGQTKAYNANNQQTGASYVHDNNGNPTTYGGVSLSFDPENHLTTYSTAMTAGYRGDGLRAWKQNASGRTYYLYDGALPVLELDAAGATTATNTFGGAALVSRRAGAQTTFYLFDPQGSVAQRTDAAGALVSSHLFNAHGAEVTTAGADPFGYKARWGYYTDRETGLQLLTHRYYDPATGRFLTKDPIGYLGGVNIYAYVGNNPVNFIDTYGLDKFKLPSDPGGGKNMPPGWQKDGRHTPPDGGERWISPDGDEGLEFNPGHPGAPGKWEPKDHWHVLKPKPGHPGRWERDKSIGDRGHFDPGEEVDLNSCFSATPFRPWDTIPAIPAPPLEAQIGLGGTIVLIGLAVIWVLAN